MMMMCPRGVPPPARRRVSSLSCPNLFKLGDGNLGCDSANWTRGYGHRWLR